MLNDNYFAEYETLIIAILLRDPKKIIDAQLVPDWFIREKSVIESMLRLTAKGIEIDVISICDDLGGSESFDRLSGIQRHTLGSAANFDIYLERVKKAFDHKTLRESIKLAQSKADNGDDVEAVVSALIESSSKINEKTSGKFSYNMKDGLRIYVENLEEVFDARESGGIGIKTGIDELDEMMGGLYPTDLVVVGARPGAGKTSIGNTILRNAAKRGVKVGFFSTEMSVIQVMGRNMSLETGIAAEKLRKADLDDKDWPLITAAMSRMKDWDYMTCDKTVVTVADIFMQARSWQKNQGLELLVIDYLQRIKPGSEGNQNLSVGAIAIGLKDIARALGIPVIALAQLNRSMSARKDKRPVMTDLRDSGIIEQEADQIGFLYRPDEDEEDQRDEIILGKNRHGACGSIPAYFDKKIMEWKGLQSMQ